MSSGIYHNQFHVDKEATYGLAKKDIKQFISKEVIRRTEIAILETTTIEVTEKEETNSILFHTEVAIVKAEEYRQLKEIERRYKEIIGREEYYWQQKKH